MGLKELLQLNSNRRYGTVLFLFCVHVWQRYWENPKKHTVFIVLFFLFVLLLALVHTVFQINRDHLQTPIIQKVQQIERHAIVHLKAYPITCQIVTHRT